MTLGRSLLLAAIAATPLAAAAAADLPDRIARLSYVEGEIAFEEAGQPARSTLPERPLLPDDRLATKANARAEIALGTAAIRLNERTALTLDDLDADTVRVRLDEGVAIVTVRELLEDERFEVVTPNTTLTLLAPGDYRIEAPRDDASIVTVHGGAAQAETAGGPVRIADGQRVRLVGREALASLETARPADAFDDWVLEREVQLADAEPSDDIREPELDRYGEWRDDPTYGRVWTPAYAYGGYDPFQYGSWQRVGFGWSWIDPYPWNRYTFHGGRWAYLHDRWCWTPPRHHPPPQHHPQPVVARETHPFVMPRNAKGQGKVMPDEHAAPRIGTRAPVAHVAPIAAPRQIAAPAQPQSSGATMRPSNSVRRSSGSGTMVARPSRESGAIAEP